MTEVYFQTAPESREVRASRPRALHGCATRSGLHAESTGQPEAMTPDDLRTAFVPSPAPIVDRTAALPTLPAPGAARPGLPESPVPADVVMMATRPLARELQAAPPAMASCPAPCPGLYACTTPRQTPGRSRRAPDPATKSACVLPPSRQVGTRPARVRLVCPERALSGPDRPSARSRGPGGTVAPPRAGVETDSEWCPRCGRPARARRAPSRRSAGNRRGNEPYS